MQIPPRGGILRHYYFQRIRSYDFGLALLERVERGKDSFQFKLLAGRLYNMNYKSRALVEAFGADLKTIRKMLISSYHSIFFPKGTWVRGFQSIFPQF